MTIIDAKNIYEFIEEIIKRKCLYQKCAIFFNNSIKNQEIEQLIEKYKKDVIFLKFSINLPINITKINAMLQDGVRIAFFLTESAEFKKLDGINLNFVETYFFALDNKILPYAKYVSCIDKNLIPFCNENCEWDKDALNFLVLKYINEGFCENNNDKLKSLNEISFANNDRIKQFLLAQCMTKFDFRFDTIYSFIENECSYDKISGIISFTVLALIVMFMSIKNNNSFLCDSYHDEDNVEQIYKLYNSNLKFYLKVYSNLYIKFLRQRFLNEKFDIKNINKNLIKKYFNSIKNTKKCNLLYFSYIFGILNNFL